MKNSELRFTYTLFPDGDGFTGRINEIHGITAQGKSEGEVKIGLIQMLNVHFALQRKEVQEKHRAARSKASAQGKTEDLIFGCV